MGLPDKVTQIRRLPNGRLEVDDPEVIDLIERSVHIVVLIRRFTGESFETVLEDGTPTMMERSESYGWRKAGKEYKPLTLAQVASPHDEIMGITPQEGFEIR